VTVPPVTVVLDNGAVQALADVNHRKHRRALAFIEATNQRGGRRRRLISVVVPVAVRVEARWDRGAPGAAELNRISRARDVVLDGRRANRTVELRGQTGVSVVDAAVGQAAEASPGPAAILTSDTSDMRHLAGVVTSEVRVVHL
jgi:hypothetical protein